MSNKIQIYNSLTRKKEVFIPKKRGRVSLYSCGPTVYNYVHIGNLRSFVFADTLKRLLKAHGYIVSHVMNITDVGHLVGDGDDGDDKIEKAAKSEGKSASSIADFYTKAFRDDLESLSIQEPDYFPKATDHIKEQIALIKELEENGLIYTISDGVYFSTGDYPDYMKLLGVSHDESSGEHARIEVNEEKRNPHDFALWKFSKEAGKRLQEWDSPWGKGFPGWHIECSAMALKYLSNPIDIHTGGIDFYTIHHPNEIAQSEGAGHKPFVRFFMYNEFLNLKNAKMAKSEGNVITLSALRKEGIPARAYRYYLLNTHYRQKITFSTDAVTAAHATVAHLDELIAALPDKAKKEKTYTQKIFNAFDDDLNTPMALGFMWEALRADDISGAQKRYVIQEADRVFGLELLTQEAIPGDIVTLAHERDLARAAGDFEKADELRAAIANEGYTVKDTEKGSVIFRSHDV